MEMEPASNEHLRTLAHSLAASILAAATALVSETKGLRLHTRVTDRELAKRVQLHMFLPRESKERHCSTSSAGHP